MSTKANAKPLVSMIVTTYNNTTTLYALLNSIASQTYQNLELVVVDNYSTDDTLEIAKKYTSKVYVKGPERCTQRNYGVQLARGKYVMILDSDMELGHGIVAACVGLAESNPDMKGIIVPEESFGKGFWAQCKRLERSFYVGVDWIEAARFYHRAAYQQVGGFDESMVSGEDWDLSERVATLGKIGRITEPIRHNEEHLHLFKTLRKKSYYAQKFSKYTTQKTPQSNRNPYVIVLRRFGLFLSRPHKLFRNPILGLGVLFMKCCEFGFGAFGYLRPKETADE